MRVVMGFTLGRVARSESSLLPMPSRRIPLMYRALVARKLLEALSDMFAYRATGDRRL